MADGSSSSSAMSFIDTLLHYTLRDELLTQCPALALLCYQHMVRSLLTRPQPLHDAFAQTSRQDALSAYLRCRSVHELLQYICADDDNDNDAGDDNSSNAAAADDDDKARMQRQLRRSFRTALSAASTPACLRTSSSHTNNNSSDAVTDDATALHMVSGVPHFAAAITTTTTATSSDGGAAVAAAVRPVSATTLYKASQTSRRFLRSVTACALSGSLQTLRERKQNALAAMVQQAHLVPTTTSSTTRQNNNNSSSSRNEQQQPQPSQGGEGTVTSAGLNFCMMPLQQQWWVLVCAAVGRVLALTQSSGSNSSSSNRSSSRDASVLITRPLLWQLLAVLATLDAERHLYAFPERDADMAGYHLLARLAEIGLVYPVLADGNKCFVLSPHFRHALTWHATAPLCLSLMLSSKDEAATGNNSNNSSNSSDAVVRREDVDMIITETNFRLYAYTRNADLLRILDQFAVREEVVEDTLVCYRITRSSFAAALYKGIGARQVLKFLSLRAHPSMRRRQRPQRDDNDDDDAATTTRNNNNNDSGDAAHEFAVPQSICDQLFMWEVECHRVTFQPQLVLLRNVTATQQELLTRLLAEAGEADAVVHAEAGYVVVREAVYDRLLAPLLTTASSEVDAPSDAS